MFKIRQNLNNQQMIASTAGSKKNCLNPFGKVDLKMARSECRERGLKVMSSGTTGKYLHGDYKKAFLNHMAGLKRFE